MKRALVVLMVAGCGGTPTQPAAPSPAASIPPPPSASVQPVEPAPSSSAPRVVRPPEPKGPAAFALNIEPGKRQPLSWVGSIEAIRPPANDADIEAWTSVVLSVAGRSESFGIRYSPVSLALPFAVGDRIAIQIDCRKGGWHRACDATIRDTARRLLVLVSGTGGDETDSGWKVERGELATSHVRPGQEKSVEHTYSLKISSERAEVVAMPHEWRRVLVHGRSYLVTGYEVSWEGARPPDAHDHRTYAVLAER
ncbi:MAG: hypothetical protein U0263_00290 [Polyangiaceae bacterium]